MASSEQGRTKMQLESHFGPIIIIYSKVIPMDEFAISLVVVVTAVLIAVAVVKPKLAYCTLTCSHINFIIMKW